MISVNLFILQSQLSVPHDDLQQHASFTRTASHPPLPPGGLDPTVIDVLADINAHLDHDPRSLIYYLLSMTSFLISLQAVYVPSLQALRGG